MEEIRENLTRGRSEENKERLDALNEKDALCAGKMLTVLSDDPLSRLYSDTSSRYYSLGEDMFSDMLRDISEAERYVFLEYFIIDEGVAWDRLHTLLVKKAKEGVEVRVLYDDIGCMKTLPQGFGRSLSAEGIKCSRFGRVTPRISNVHNNRDHRKICVVDGKISYTGGANIADEYINARDRFGHWKDGGVRLYGRATEGLLALFLSLWDLSSTTLTDIEKYKCKEMFTDDGGYYLTLGTGPMPVYKRPVGKRVLLDIINQSKRYVYMTSPYLIIDYELTESLVAAARRGVDVRIITPKRADKRLVKLMTKSSYPYLIEGGVSIYEYAPGFIHEKTVVSDDEYALIGTINLDYRSLVHHFEDAVLIYGSPTVIRVREDYLRTISVSERCALGRARLSLKERIVRNLIRIFAPLL
jgi:cardiolipin synthase